MTDRSALYHQASLDCENAALAEAKGKVAYYQNELAIAETAFAELQYQNIGSVEKESATLLDAIKRFDEYGVVVIHRDHVDRIREWHEQNKSKTLLVPAVAALLPPLETLGFVDVELRVFLFAEVESHGRERSVDWDNAEETWIVEGHHKINGHSVDAVLSEELRDHSDWHESDDREEGTYRQSRSRYFHNAVLLIANRERAKFVDILAAPWEGSSVRTETLHLRWHKILKRPGYESYDDEFDYDSDEDSEKRDAKKPKTTE